MTGVPSSDQGDGAVLQLAGGVGLGVDVGDLLQLQAALQRQGVVQVPPDEEHILLVPPATWRRHWMSSVCSSTCSICPGSASMPRTMALYVSQIHGAHHIAEIQPQQVQHHHLGAVRLGGGHGDLRARPRCRARRRLSRAMERAHHVDDAQDPGAAASWPPAGRPWCPASRRTG